MGRQLELRRSAGRLSRVPGSSALPGTACNDGNANTATTPGTPTGNCDGSAGRLSGYPGGSALPGTRNDGNEHGQRHLGRELQLRRSADRPSGAPGGSAPGTACNDGNANTGNDTVGRQLQLWVSWSTVRVLGGSALPGTACNDGNANTGNDTWDASRNCVGQYRSTARAMGQPGRNDGTRTRATNCNLGRGMACKWK